MNRRSFCSNLTARSTALARAMVALPTRPATLPLLATALAVLVVSGVLFALYVHPAYAQDGSAPAKPKGLSATATHGQVVLTWADPQDDSITGYVILRRVRVNDEGGEFSELVADTGSAATTYTDDTVAAETTYTYRIKAINKHGVSERSRWFHIDIPAAPEPEEEQSAEPPAKPTGLSATASHDSVALTWDDPGDDSIAGYVILRRVRVNDTGGEFSELVPDTGNAATTYTDDTVAASTTYTYRIKAINEHGTSERSRWFHIDTPAPPVPARPTGLSAAASHDSVTLTWNDPNDETITGYVILRRHREDDPKGEFRELTPDTRTAATTYTDETVEADTPYAYRIKAINAAGASQRSQWVHIDTAAAPEEGGTVTLSQHIPRAGNEVEATLSDPEGSVSETSWQWSRTNNSNSTYTNIKGATSRAYTPGDEDVAKFLRAEVTYTDAHGSRKRSSSEIDHKVLRQTPSLPIIMSAHRHPHHDIGTNECFHTHQHTHHDAIDYITEDNGNEPVQAGDKLYYPVYEETHNHHGRKYQHGPKKQSNGQLHAESPSYIESCNGSAAPQHSHTDGEFTRDTSRVRADVVAIQLESRFITVNEGSSGNLRVKLGSRPSMDTTIILRYADGSDPSVTVSPLNLTFTTANWNDYQQVRASAANDSDNEDGEGLILLEWDSGDPRYEGVYEVASVTEADND